MTIFSTTYIFQEAKICNVIKEMTMFEQLKNQVLMNSRHFLNPHKKIF